MTEEQKAIIATAGESSAENAGEAENVNAGEGTGDTTKQDTAGDENAVAEEQQASDGDATGEGENKAEDKASVEPLDPSKFNVPDGFQLPAESIKELTDIVGGKLSQDDAQRLVDLAVASQKAQAEAETKQREEWRAQVSKMTEQDRGRAMKAVEAFADDESRSLLLDTVVGDHPAMVQFLARIGAQMEEHGMVHDQARGYSDSPEARLKRLYPNT